MLKVIRSTVVPMPVESVWEVLRDFNSHASWHPAIAESVIENNQASDRVGCVRRFTLQDGQELREQLLTLSDMEMAYSYCLLDTPIPLFNYVSHVRLTPVTDGDHSYWEWQGQFNTRSGQEDEMTRLVGDGIYTAGFAALKKHLGAA